MTPRLGALHEEILDAIAADEFTDDTPGVTYSESSRGRSFRLWAGDGSFMTCTPQIRRLLDAGLVRTFEGMRRGRGYVELTAAGKAHRAARPEP